MVCFGHVLELSNRIGGGEMAPLRAPSSIPGTENSLEGLNITNMGQILELFSRSSDNYHVVRTGTLPFGKKKYLSLHKGGLSRVILLQRRSKRFLWNSALTVLIIFVHNSA